MAKIRTGLTAWLVVAATMILAVAGPAAAEESRIVAVGDLHGDYDAFRAIVEDAGLVNGRGKWIGGKTIFVQTGDIPDRGPDTLKIIRHLMKLEKQARRKGGRVVPLIGNHEAMNMLGDLRYVTAEEFAAFRTRKSKRLRDRYFREHRDEFRARQGGAIDDEQLRAKFDADVPLGLIEHRAAWSPKGEIGLWILQHDALVKLNGALFVHGGVSDAYAGFSIDEINAKVRGALAGGEPHAILTDELGPLWYRGAAGEDEAAGAEVNRVLTAFEAERMVIGHTPSLDGIRPRFGGKVIQIDTGISGAYGGVRSWLEIENGAVTAHNAGIATPIPPVETQP